MKKDKFIHILRDQPVIWLFGLVMILFSIISPAFLSLENFMNIVVQATPLIIVACGISFVLITAGIDLSVGSIMFLVAVFLGKLVNGGFPLWAGIPIVLCIGILYGSINALFINKYKIIPFIVTLATLYIGRGLGLYVSDTRAINLPEAVLQMNTIDIIGIPLPMIIMLLFVILSQFILSYTVYGRHLYAIGQDQIKARKSGIQVAKNIFWAYVICALFASVGGLIGISQIGAVSPNFAHQFEFMAIAAAVLGGTSLFGGTGSVFPGTLLGALLIQMIQNGLVIMNADPYMYPMVTAGIIFLIIVIDSQKQQLKFRES